MADRFSVIPAVYVYLRRERQVLLQRRGQVPFMAGRWAAGAAGHVETGELPADAAVRELAEELGLQVTPQELIPEFSALCIHGVEPRAQRVDFVFTLDCWQGEPQIMEPQKCAALQWFSLDDLPELVSWYEAPFLQRLADGVGEPFLQVRYDIPDGD